ncbi:hypothetical protein EJB05_57507, partial [Eragrostis curvula]
MCFSFDTTEIPTFESHLICGFNLPPSKFLERVYHKPRYYSSGLVGCVSFNVRRKASYPDFAYRRSWSGYRWKYFIMDDSSKHNIKGKGLLPFHQAWNKSVPIMDERLKNMTAKVTELVVRG